MEAVEITSASQEDAEAILHLQHEAYQSEARLYNDWNIPPLTQTMAQFLVELRANLVLKAVSGSALLGSVRARNDNGVVHIGRLIVAPAAQRRGIGGSLLRAVETHFANARCFELFTGTQSEGNIRLYRKHGYEVAHEKNLSPGIALVFMRKLNEHP
ncbi:MAG: GNAT family N-acetyltransferase [Azonexus sp.]|jgi:ribosomal protein S18 acetylase RimI-like enzyme|nr:GNAT family N-acetyltransferase [Azonexus sp.]